MSVFMKLEILFLKKSYLFFIFLGLLIIFKYLNSHYNNKNKRLTFFFQVLSISLCAAEDVKERKNAKNI